MKALRAGIVWVNHMQPTYVEAPWGGYKQSGFGRELGPWGIEEYLETKQVLHQPERSADRLVLKSNGESQLPACIPSEAKTLQLRHVELDR